MSFLVVGMRRGADESPGIVLECGPCGKAVTQRDVPPLAQRIVAADASILGKITKFCALAANQKRKLARNQHPRDATRSRIGRCLSFFLTGGLWRSESGILATSRR